MKVGETNPKWTNAKLELLRVPKPTTTIFRVFQGFCLQSSNWEKRSEREREREICRGWALWHLWESAGFRVTELSLLYQTLTKMIIFKSRSFYSLSLLNLLHFNGISGSIDFALFFLWFLCVCIGIQILVEGRARSRTAILNRPSSLNALNAEMVLYFILLLCFRFSF